MLTSIVVLTYNQLDYTKKCIDSIRDYTTRDTYEIIVVDNNSTDGTVDWLRVQNDIKVIYNQENLGFPKGCNQGIKISKGDNILLLNNDTVVTHNWLDNLITCLYSSDKIGAVGPITNYCSNYQAIGVSYNNDLVEMHKFAKTLNISNPEKWEERLRLIGFCLLVKRSVVEAIGFLDEQFSPGNFEDDDYCLRIRNEGYRIMLCNDTFIHHFGSVSFGKDFSIFSSILNINKEKFKLKWGIDPSSLIEIRKDITSKIVTRNIENPTIMQIGCESGGTLLDIKNKLPKSELYGIESKEKYIGNIEHNAKIRTGSVNLINEFPKNFFDFIIVTIYEKDTTYYFELFSTLKKYLKNSGTFIITMPKEFNVKDVRIESQLSKKLTNFSYEQFPSNNHTLVCLKSNISQNEITNTQKISFISSINDEEMYNKAIYYIKKLEVPKGYEIELISIKNAQSMTSAYNDAMHRTDAKYKVYMHQDVFITNPNFIIDILDIFQNNKKVGMIGVVGAKNVPRNGIWWEDPIKYGKVFESHTGKMELLKFREVDKKYESVSLIDGLIMITQYDIPWRDDIFDDWHFYDVSQSLEFKNAGFEVVIPKQLSPWCIHDCGIVSTNNYETYRKIFVNKYINISDITAIETDIKKKQKPRFVTLLPGLQNVHLIKGVGMIPYVLYKYYGYDSTLPVYEGGEYSYANNEVKGLKLDYLQNTGNTKIDGYYYLLHNARKIDILQVYHLLGNTFKYIEYYKSFNPNGKVFLKLDVDRRIKNINYHTGYNEHTKNLIRQCDLVSVESKVLQEYLNTNWGIKAEYIPIGFYTDNFKKINYVKYEEKENIICTVGRLGSIQKATEVLLEAFAKASAYIGNWKLKLIGSVEEHFNQYIEDYFKRYPHLKDNVIFTGVINDRKELEKEYRKAKIFCLPSRWESFGTVLAEAISNGCYIITTNVSSSADITDNCKYGDIFEFDNIDQLSKLLIDNCNNEDRLKKLINKIQNHAYYNFNWVKICEKIHILLQEK